ncbi:MAG: CDP-diacylglycerol--glycerol-3-phosphate 3-phosphatidyltransferase [Clostridia bacterium]|nr:CDP-diacylglycerol--glycerol-3-phosphate 3-phosphatidyltransferase [Clostridia bacterium]
MLKQVPNALTIARFILIPFIIISLVKDDYITTFIFLTISGLTDVLDGFIARKFDLISNFGKLIDPLADKTTQIAILTTLALKGIIPIWIIVIIFLKEFAMIAGASFLYGKELVVSSKWYGKLATVLFYVAIASSLAIKYFNITFKFDIYLYYLALIFTIFSLFMYFHAFYTQGYLKKENLKITK